MELFSSHCNEHDIRQIFPPPLWQPWSALLCYGVPQGSCLGPFYSASPGCYKYATYADDSQIYTPLQTKELLTAVSKLCTKSTWLQELMASSTLEALVLEAFRIAVFSTLSSFG